MERYTDTQLIRMRVAVAALEALTSDGTLFNFLRGKVLLMKDEIAREEAMRAEEFKAREAAAEAARKARAEEARLAAEAAAATAAIEAEDTLETPAVAPSQEAVNEDPTP